MLMRKAQPIQASLIKTHVSHRGGFVQRPGEIRVNRENKRGKWASEKKKIGSLPALSLILSALMIRSDLCSAGLRADANTAWDESWALVVFFNFFDDKNYGFFRFLSS